VKCVSFLRDFYTVRYSNKTNLRQEMVSSITLAFCCQVVIGNYENPSIICKSYSDKTSGSFVIWTECVCALVVSALSRTMTIVEDSAYRYP